MAHKTLTISEDAYRALAKLKNPDESFTKVILRLSTKSQVGKLSEYMEKMGPDPELAANIEAASKRMRSTRLRKAKL
ncbi:MAG: antitoxin VapB family protein [Nitrososphaerales archaeon]